MHKIVEEYKNGRRDFFCARLSGANLSDADLSYANLSGTDLSYANLSGADLSYANFSGADLSGADLSYTNLFRAKLSGAKLSGAKLSGANLSGANLSGANLSGANLSDATLPAPTALLLVNWRVLSDELTTACMRFDAINHPDPHAFQRWAEGGPCPYEGIRLQRCVRFRERKDCWSYGPVLSAYELMVALIREKCADSDYHDRGEEK